MSSRPLISIIIPAFNAASVLGDTLRSVQQQQYPYFEALVVDDGSADETAAVARHFVEQDQRFVLLQQPNRGVAAARNAGLAAARGEMDRLSGCRRHMVCREAGPSDSVPSRLPRSGFDLQQLLHVGRTERPAIALCESRQHFRMSDFPHLLTRFNLLGTSTVMVRRDLMSRVGPFDPELSLAQDWDMWLRLAEAGCQTRRIREPLARYRVWPGNASNQTLRMAQSTVWVLQKRLIHCRLEEWRRSYRRSLAIAEGKSGACCCPPASRDASRIGFACGVQSLATLPVASQVARLVCSCPLPGPSGRKLAEADGSSSDQVRW